MDLRIASLGNAYRKSMLHPEDVINTIYDRIAKRGDDGVWNALTLREEALECVKRLGAMDIDRSPLWGIPFAIKDNIDVPGLPTTNGLPESSYMPTTTGPAVSRLLAAGAIPIGKTSLDQFAVGLVGIRTRGRSCSCAFSEEHIPGGSSAGSAVAVAGGLVSFSLGNDAAGSGRVPAALNNIVGFKPTPGVVSNRAVSGGGVARSIETLSVFAQDVPDALTVFQLMAGYDALDAFSRPEADSLDFSACTPALSSFSFGIPDSAHLKFYGDTAAEALFHEAIKRLERLGGKCVSVDFRLLDEAQRILYEGPWIAERATWLEPQLLKYRDLMHPVTRQIIESGNRYTAKDLFRAICRLAQIKQSARDLFKQINVLVVPTTPTTYTKTQVELDPIALNSTLGTYTNFANLLGMCATAVPNGFRPDGLPQGITFLGLELQDVGVAHFAASYQRSSGLPLGGPQVHSFS
jgi:allophanate hydrolase